MAKSSRLPPARAEHIGSFLRPAELHAELERVYAPKHTALLAEERAKDLNRLHSLEDNYIKAVIRKQLALVDRRVDHTCELAIRLFRDHPRE
jgi:hypothetical protein